MGLCFQSIIGDGPKDSEMNKNIENGWIWMVIRRDPSPRKDGLGYDWHIQGTASKESIAVEMCANETYVIGPIPIDTALPEKPMAWAGSYCPLKST